MDVSYSAWKRTVEENDSLVLGGESFSFLFDRRYTNRLNRMSRVFFQAYCKATKELAAEEDRFPSLSEIDAKMESGAVYAFKDRLMKNTQFFEEIKISGVSYLVPRARRFIDTTGTYTDMTLNFEEGDVTLPSRRKVPMPPEPGQAEETETPEQEEDGEGLEASAEEEEIKTGVAAESAPNAYEKELAREVEAPSESPAAPEPQAEDEMVASPAKPAFAEDVKEAAAEETAPAQALPPEAEELERTTWPERPAEVSSPGEVATVTSIPTPPSGSWMQSSKSRIGLAAMAFLILVVALFVGAPNLLSSQSVQFVEYSAYLTNSSEGTYLTLEIQNARSMANDLELVLPLNIDRSISARGGVVTISHANGTIIRMNSNNDASIRVYLNRSLETVPVVLNIDVPEGYDSGVEVHGASYDLKRKDEHLILKLNVTLERVNFEQSYRTL